MSDYIFKDFDPTGFACSEQVRVPATTPFEVWIDYVPKLQPSPDIAISGLIRVNRVEFLETSRYYCDFRKGLLIFNSTEAGQTFTVTYTGLGTFLRKELLDEISGEGGDTSIYLAPEYDGVVQYNDGSHNTGILTLGHDATSLHNYYNWIASTSPDQDTDLVVRFHIPDNWENFRKIRIWNKGNTGTNLSVRLFDTEGVEVPLLGNMDISNLDWTETEILKN